MNTKILPQEGLKLIACVTMLLDHMGAVLFPYNLWLRIIGRLAFPIYCFLLAEGAHYTKNPTKYGLRILIGILLSEIPFDLCLYGHFTWAAQSVMVTLFLAFLMALAMKRVPLWIKPLIAIPFALLAQWLGTDYGGAGVLMVAVFVIAKEFPETLLVQTVGIVIINLWLAYDTVFLQFFAVAAMIPIALYSGKKLTRSKGLQWAFYLFYPVHLAAIWLISLL